MATLREAPPHKVYVPRTTPIVPGAAMAPSWETFFRVVQDVLAMVSRQILSLTTTGLSASLGATALSIAKDTSTFYRVTARVRVSQAATVSGSATVTVRWTEKRDGVASKQAVALASNVVGDQATLVAVIAPDTTVPVTIEVAYASSGATPLKYDLDVTLEDMP